MMKMAFLVGSFALGAAGLAERATASILDWELENVLFDDGGRMSGAFSVNTTNGAVIAFDITTTTGSILAGFHYDGRLALPAATSSVEIRSLSKITSRIGTFNLTLPTRW
jgi:ethanolamine utilization microcompartment shell protein EutS